MRNEHWRAWSCPLGCQQIFATARDFDAHAENVHSKHNTSGSLQSLRALGARPDLKAAQGGCPLCSDIQISSDRQYSTHVADHLESPALFALPDMGTASDEGDSQSEEGTPSNVSLRDSVEATPEASPLQEKHMNIFSYETFSLPPSRTGSDDWSGGGDTARAGGESPRLSVAYFKDADSEFEGKSMSSISIEVEKMDVRKAILTGQITQ